MTTFIMLTRLAPGSLRDPAALEELEQAVMSRIRAQTPGVEWRASYAVLGATDYLDIFDAPDVEAATKVSVIVRTFGHAQTEIWAATEWPRFKQTIRDLPRRAE